MNQKHQQNLFYVVLNVSLMVEIAIQMKSGKCWCECKTPINHSVCKKD